MLSPAHAPLIDQLVGDLADGGRAEPGGGPVDDRLRARSPLLLTHGPHGPH